MSLNDIVEELLKIDLMEAEANDRGQGLEPLLNEFVYDMPSISEEEKISRIRIISEYYRVIYDRSHGNVPRAYNATRKFCMKIYVQHYAKKMEEALDKKKLGHCYDLSGRFVMDNPDWSLVHGTITRKDGYTIPHAWAEKMERIGSYDMRMVNDPVMGMGELPWDAYERLLGAKPGSKYTSEEMNLKCIKNKHWGPWESVCENKDEMVAFYEKRTREHIARVQKAAKKIANTNILSDKDNEILLNNIEVHDQSKFEEPEYTPYVSLTWRHKIENETGDFDPMKDKGYQTPGLLHKKDENEATLHHVRNNSHHPEYWLENKTDANINAEDRNKSDKVVDATRMPDVYVAEMCADWQAMSEEIKKNTARQWFNKCKDVRWHFSPHQEELIDVCLKVFEDELQESLSESAIDFPTDDLPRAIWDKNKGKYSLKPTIKAKVMKYIKSYPGRDLMAVSNDIHICGSLATNLYTQYSDFDVHMVIDKEKIKDKAKQEELTKEVLKWSDANPEDIEGYPCHIYMQDNEAQEYVGDSLWDLQKDFWAKGPKVSRKNFNPYTYYREILGEVEKKAKECDIKLGELSRSVIDYTSIKAAYKQIPRDAKASLRALLQKKLSKIEDDIEALSAYKKEWAGKRRSASQPTSIKQAVTDDRMQEEWEKANAIFKYLTKYDYVTTIKALDDILDDDAIEDKDVEDIKDVLDIESDFEKVSPDLDKKEKEK